MIAALVAGVRRSPLRVLRLLFLGIVVASAIPSALRIAHAGHPGAAAACAVIAAMVALR